MSATLPNLPGPPSAGAAPVAVASTPPVNQIKIKTLRICDFRAFAGPEPVTIALDGKNLLVYGENGAGKSSIYHALNEFFSVERSDPGARQSKFSELRNKFSNLTAAEGYIEVELDDGKTAARWDNTRHPVDLTAPGADPRIVNGAYRKAILDYRALLDTNYMQGAGEVNLFDICVHALLRDYPAVHNGRQVRLFDLWQQLRERISLRRYPRINSMHRVGINDLAASFNAGLQEALVVLKPRIDELLAELGWADVTLAALTSPGLAYNGATRSGERAYTGKTVTPKIVFRTLALSAPQTFLNEARLSALALSIYFAGRKLSATTLQADTPKIMVLDDVLIGLDQSNRLPVLQVLEKHFADWQIILLTYDRVWFEMARFHVAERKDWATLQMFEEVEPTGSSRPVLRPQGADPVASNLDTAREFHADHHHPAAAVHARVAFEQSLKKVCERKAIPVRFQSDPRLVTTDNLLTAIEKWLEGKGEAEAMAPSIQNVKLFRKVVLNPFSHSTPVNLTATEVIGAIDAVAALHQAFQNHIKGEAGI